MILLRYMEMLFYDKKKLLFKGFSIIKDLKFLKEWTPIILYSFYLYNLIQTIINTKTKIIQILNLVSLFGDIY